MMSVRIHQTFAPKASYFPAAPPRSLKMKATRTATYLNSKYRYWVSVTACKPWRRNWAAIENAIVREFGYAEIQTAQEGALFQELKTAPTQTGTTF